MAVEGYMIIVTFIVIGLFMICGAWWLYRDVTKNQK